MIESQHLLFIGFFYFCSKQEEINAAVLALSITPNNPGKLASPVEIIFQHYNVRFAVYVSFFFLILNYVLKD